MFLLIILVLVGLFVYFSFIKKDKCDGCGKDVTMINKFGDKKYCDECLKNKKVKGYKDYYFNAFLKNIDNSTTIDSYEKYIKELYDDKNLMAGHGSITNKYIMAPHLAICPTVVVSTLYSDIAFRANELVAITLEEDVFQKELDDNHSGYVITLYTKNKFIPFIHTCVIGKKKLFKFSSTQEKERREALGEGLDIIFKSGFYKLKIPYNNNNGLKKYIQENEKELIEKNLFDNDFTKEDLIKNIKASSLISFKELFNKALDNNELSEAQTNAMEYLNKLMFNDPIALMEL